MDAQAWVGLGVGVATVSLTFSILLFKFGRDQGVIKSGVNELLGREERTNKRVDSIELRLNDHTERIARLEAPPRGR